MAYPKAASLTANLQRGMVDGSYKQIIKDRGGVVEMHAPDERQQLATRLYGIGEAPFQEMPDGSGPVTTAFTVPTPIAGA